MYKFVNLPDGHKHWGHFIASLMDDAIYDEVSYVFEVAGEQFAAGQDFRS